MAFSMTWRKVATSLISPVPHWTHPASTPFRRTCTGTQRNTCHLQRKTLQRNVAVKESVSEACQITPPGRGKHVLTLRLSRPQDVRLNGLVVPFFPENDTASHGLETLAPPAESVAVEPGELSDDVCARTDPCRNGGTCENVFFSDFR